MVITRNEMAVEERENLRGGKGVLNFVHCIAGKGAVQPNTNMLAEITLPAGTSIGYHSHTDETEFYIILEGNGTVNDNGKELPVQAGDTMVTGGGDSHSIANTGNSALKMIAAIIKG
jgi:mannose-6-phosphate isomerase-like protein (cupin superfamily)